MRPRRGRNSHDEADSTHTYMELEQIADKAFKHILKPAGWEAVKGKGLSAYVFIAPGFNRHNAKEGSTQFDSFASLGAKVVEVGAEKMVENAIALGAIKQPFWEQFLEQRRLELEERKKLEAQAEAEREKQRAEEELKRQKQKEKKLMKAKKASSKPDKTEAAVPVNTVKLVSEIEKTVAASHQVKKPKMSKKEKKLTKAPKVAKPNSKGRGITKGKGSQQQLHNPSQGPRLSLVSVPKLLAKGKAKSGSVPTEPNPAKRAIQQSVSEGPPPKRLKEVPASSGLLTDNVPTVGLFDNIDGEIGEARSDKASKVGASHVIPTREASNAAGRTFDKSESRTSTSKPVPVEDEVSDEDKSMSMLDDEQAIVLVSEGMKNGNTDEATDTMQAPQTNDYFPIVIQEEPQDGTADKSKKPNTATIPIEKQEFDYELEGEDAFWHHLNQAGWTYEKHGDSWQFFAPDVDSESAVRGVTFFESYEALGKYVKRVGIDAIVGGGLGRSPPLPRSECVAEIVAWLQGIFGDEVNEDTLLHYAKNLVDYGYETVPSCQKKLAKTSVDFLKTQLGVKPNHGIYLLKYLRRGNTRSDEFKAQPELEAGVLSWLHGVFENDEATDDALLPYAQKMVSYCKRELAKTNVKFLKAEFGMSPEHGKQLLCALGQGEDCDV